MSSVLNANASSRPGFDVLIVGGGAAGLYTALSLPPQLRIGLVTKDTLSLSASDWAQGGIAAAIDPDDSPELHAGDTLAAGVGLCEPEAVNFLVEHAPEQVKMLLSMGIAFDRSADRLAFTLEAAHSRPRVLHAADTTGHALIETLTHQVLQRANITLFPQTFTLDVWIHPQRQVCQGIKVMAAAKISWLRAPVVVLATGGGGKVYAQTTNPALSTGDGMAIAWRRGAVVRDLEFFQFHPTALTVPGAPRFLISEAVRGEGAYLLDAAQHRFMFDYHPLGELAPRDIVSRSIFLHLEKTAVAGAGIPHVWLDLRHIPPEKIQRRFPKIIQVCRDWGIDLFAAPIPVAPAAHYWMGGIVTDLQGATSIPGLYAVGEVASTGVHGANRLASNSLLECLVFGAQFAHLQAKPMADDRSGEGVVNSGELPEVAAILAADEAQKSAAAQLIKDIAPQLPALMWHCAGICRTASGLEMAIAQVQDWRQKFVDLPLTRVLTCQTPGISIALPDETWSLSIRHWAEVQNLLDNAYLILNSARFRTESRGGHSRLDYPDTDPAWQVHTLVQGSSWSRSAPIATPSISHPSSS